MSQMLMSSIPGFFDLADSTIPGGQPLTDYALAKISHNAKFGAVRCEIIYMGFYGPGDTVAPPVSPVDGYSYSYAECLGFSEFCTPPAHQPRAMFQGKPHHRLWPIAIPVRAAWRFVPINST